VTCCVFLSRLLIQTRWSAEFFMKIFSLEMLSAVMCLVLISGSSDEDVYDVLADLPSDCDVDESAQSIVFECSQQPFLPIYYLQLDKMRQ